MPSLRLIGYWYSRDEPAYPRPQQLVDRNWLLDERARLVTYLRSGVTFSSDLGYSHCRFKGGPPDREMGCAELTDGVWAWAEGLPIYVERYHVKLPTELVEHARSNKYQIPRGIDVHSLESAEVDVTWWKKWAARNVKPRFSWRYLFLRV